MMRSSHACSSSSTRTESSSGRQQACLLRQYIHPVQCLICRSAVRMRCTSLPASCSVRCISPSICVMSPLRRGLALMMSTRPLMVSVGAGEPWLSSDGIFVDLTRVCLVERNKIAHQFPFGHMEMTVDEFQVEVVDAQFSNVCRHSDGVEKSL